MRSQRDGFKDTRSVEQQLTQLYTSCQPAPEFENRLRENLDRYTQDIEVKANIKSGMPANVKKRWLAYGLGLLVVVVLIVCHQPVLAAVQWLFNFGYLFDRGVADLTDTRVLVGPTSQVRGTGILTITDALITPESTRIWLHFENAAPLPEPTGFDLPDTWLEMDNGAILEPVGWGSTEDVLDYIDFEGLPENVTQVTLVLFSDWRIPLQFNPAGEVEEIQAAIVYPEACQDVHGVKLCVQAAAFDRQGTHILLAGETTDPSLGLDNGLLVSFNPLAAEDRVLLLDDQDRVMEPARNPASSISVAEAMEERPGGLERAQEALHFEPIAADTTSLTLHIPAITAEIPAEAAFEIDLGDHPQVGDVFEIDISFEIDEQTIRFVKAEVVNYYDLGVFLRLVSQPVEPYQGRLVELLHVDQSLPPGDTHGTIEVGGVSVPTREMEILFDLEDDKGEVIGGVRQLTVDSAQLLLLGPIELSWPVPPQP